MEKVEKEKITERKDATKERQEEKQDSTNKQVGRVEEQLRSQAPTSTNSESKHNVWAVCGCKIGWGIALLIVVIGVLWGSLKGRGNKKSPTSTGL
ncbi:hypothetical protein [Sphingobacterium hotanense]|uniref:Uncharacterized protein n=1 Tax=Sphingobacterium hotanense TaxID=649196 RepID=A0ABT7NHW8_9SPHI|nr:hypothetical protein [Sphingobacterium hotanense]MDM1046738.1 hypothetical protein [Sphingobacterium hotanense]